MVVTSKKLIFNPHTFNLYLYYKQYYFIILFHIFSCMKLRNYFPQFHLSLKQYKTGLMWNKTNNHPFQAILSLGFRPKTTIIKMKVHPFREIPFNVFLRGGDAI